MIRSATPDAIAEAARHLRGGGVVAFPTETVYGLGAYATDALAVARVFAIKDRPSFDPLIVHLADAADLDAVARAVPDAARRLLARYWPGPLTVVLPRTALIPDLVTAGLDSVAVRVPDHAVAQALLRAVGRPIAAPSANPFGYVSPTTAAHVADQLGAAVPLILDGGPCRVGLESTIVSFLATQPALLRPGLIGLEELEAILGPLRLATAQALPTAPGQLPRHYAPRTPLVIVASPAAVPLADRAAAALLTAGPVSDTSGYRDVFQLSPDGDLVTAAARLFGALRALDAGSYTRADVAAVPVRGSGRAILYRRRRAAHAED